MQLPDQPHSFILWVAGWVGGWLFIWLQDTEYI